MSYALLLWAGMPGPPQLTDLAALRVDSISFFALVFLGSAKLLALAWNGLRRDFPGLFFVGNYLRGPAIGNCVDQAKETAQSLLSSYT